MMNYLLAIGYTIVSVMSSPVEATATNEGSLSRYDPGVMEIVLEWRHTNGIPSGFDPYGKEYDGYIAVMNCSDVGKEAELTLTINYERQHPIKVLISDCTESEATKDWMLSNGIVAELDYDSWVANGIKDGEGAWAELEIIE